MKQTWNPRRKTGVLSTAITLAVVCCLVLLNVVAAVVTKRYPVKIDLTANQVFRLSQDSIDYVGGLEKQVGITVLNTRDGFERGGDYYKQALAVMEQYAQYNHNITLGFVDLLANPAYTSKYPDKDLKMNDILVSSGENLEVLTAYDIFDVQMSWYGGSIASSKAEQAMTGAILNVTSEEKPKIAFSTGHEETDTALLQETLRKNGFEIAAVPTLLEEIPQDTEILVLAAPKRDFSEEETAKLDAFLENGGEYGKNLLYFASLQQGRLANLEGWLGKWGLAAGDGAVAETSPRRVISNNAYFGIADPDDAGLGAMMHSADVPIAMPLTRPVRFLFSENLGYSTRTLLSYSESAGLADENVEQISDIVPSGPIPVAGMSTYTKDGGKSGVAVFGTDQIFSQQMLGIGSLANADYLLSVCDTLAGRQNVFSIPPKTIGGGTLAITQAQVFLFAALLMILLPVAVLAAGVAVWIRRRRR